MTMTEHEMTDHQRVMANLDAAINHQTETFALYRDAVDQIAEMERQGTCTRRQMLAAQERADAAYQQFGFATAGVERAVRAAMPGATERKIHDRMQEV